MNEHVHTKFRTASGSIRCSGCKQYFVDYDMKYRLEKFLEDKIVQQAGVLVFWAFIFALILPWVFRFFNWWWNLALK